MSCEWAVAAWVRRSFQVSAGAGPKTPLLPQLAPAARAWLTRASRAGWKSGKPQVAPLLLAETPGAAAGGGASPPPPHPTSTATAADPTTGWPTARNHTRQAPRPLILSRHPTHGRPRECNGAEALSEH